MVEHQGVEKTLVGEGNGPIDAAVQALNQLGIVIQVRSYEERSMGKGGDARACAFMEVSQEEVDHDYYGVGIDANIITASIRALISGINRLEATGVLVMAA